MAAAWGALSSAVAVLTARQAEGADLRSVVSGERPDRVIFGLEVIAAAALQVLEPEDKGAHALERLGLLALERSAEL
jgi:formate-dependent phosphoribosylglycinamide formyltransferase (GAR transformylase)